MAGETKKKNGPSPLWGTDCRSANVKLADGAGSLWGNSGLRQVPSLFVGNISKIDGTRDAHFLESNGKKGKNYRYGRRSQLLDRSGDSITRGRSGSDFFQRTAFNQRRDFSPH